MKKFLASAISGAMLLTMLAGCSTTAPGGDAAKPNDAANPATSSAQIDPNAKIVRIGVFQPASGDNGAGGKQETLGTQYANFKQPTVEIGGETYTVKLEIVDNQSSNDKAATAASELMSKNVSVVLGSYGSGVSIAASDTFKQAGVSAIGVTCTNPQVTAGNKHYFRICFLDPFQGTVLANFAVDQFQAKTAYCLNKLGDDYSGGLCNYFKQAFEAMGGTVISDEFPDGNSDFTSYITRAKNEGADVFFSPSSTDAAALIIDQASSQGMTIPIMAGDTWDSNVITKAAQGKAASVYVTTFYQEGGNPEFDAGIKEWLNANPDMLANNGGNDLISGLTAMGYDAYFTALEALKAAGSTDPAKVNEALWGVTYQGVTGDIAFEQENGDAIRDVAYVKTANTETGVWDFVKVQGIK